MAVEITHGIRTWREVQVESAAFAIDLHRPFFGAAARTYLSAPPQMKESVAQLLATSASAGADAFRQRMFIAFGHEVAEWSNRRGMAVATNAVAAQAVRQAIGQRVLIDDDLVSAAEDAYKDAMAELGTTLLPERDELLPIRHVVDASAARMISRPGVEDLALRWLNVARIKGAGSEQSRAVAQELMPSDRASHFVLGEAVLARIVYGVVLDDPARAPRRPQGMAADLAMTTQMNCLGALEQGQRFALDL